MFLYILLLTFIGLAVAVAWYVLAHDRGEREPISALWIAVGFGVLAALAAGVIEGQFIPDNSLQLGTPHNTLIISALAVGFIEETCKFLPLALFINKKRYFNEHTDGVIYFALAGLGFGLPENILYTLQFGTKTGLMRAFLLPIFHAATTGIIGYFLIKRKLAGKSAWGVITPLFFVAALHGFYDFGLVSGSSLYAAGALLTTLGLSAALFFLYLRATERDQDNGLSALGYNPSAIQGRKGELKALTSLLLGITGIIGGFFIAFFGLILGLAGLVTGTMARSASKRRVSQAGIVTSILSIMVGMGVWAYAVQQDQQESISYSASKNPLSVLAADISTPCYSMNFIDKLNVNHKSDSCDMNAFNGQTLETSTLAYKVYANKTQVSSPAAFSELAKAAIEKDVKNNLTGFNIDGERVGFFAGSPAYIVNVSNKITGVALVEAAVLHEVTSGENVFVLVHAHNGKTADLQIMESQWQWR